MFVTRTYQKPINLYQYITPNSAHPPGMIKGVVHGLLRRYYRQNTYREDYWKMAMLLYKRLKARGWDRATLGPIFIAAHEKICSQPLQNHISQSNETLSNREQIIIHMEYHPDDIPRRKVQQLFSQHCGDLFTSSIDDGGLGIKRTILAYSRPQNLRDLLQKARLHQKPGREVSTFF